MKRASILALTWVGLALILSRGGVSALAFEPRAALLVLVLPLLLVAVHVGPRVLARDLALALAPRPEDLPPESRAHAASHLRMAGGLSVAVGLLAFFTGTVGLFNRMAQAAGQAEPTEVMSGLGALLLAPVYGILLKALLHDPLAAGLEEAESRLGEELEGG